MKICDVDPALLDKIKKFRFSQEKKNRAFLMKIDTEKMLIVNDDSFDEDEYDNISIEELANEIPASQPRFVAYSYCYKHDDGRVSYPICFIFVSPFGCKPELQMMYAGSKSNLVKVAQFTKVFEVRSTEELDEEWLKSKLGFFR
ncbi:DgyrCDS1769 [Dimorphilus gyrociliatus]|uniref:DgyrCDS1769 n=1 Tax=Dimorphilus gyrociliatus TaxID=2664684 RepID=A0A7I8VA57_9ANNE|nr:DgyrCDS1769 [Dimorphilus gyrociliatus]